MFCILSISVFLLNPTIDTVSIPLMYTILFPPHTIFSLSLFLSFCICVIPSLFLFTLAIQRIQASHFFWASSTKTEAKYSFRTRFQINCEMGIRVLKISMLSSCDPFNSYKHVIYKWLVIDSCKRLICNSRGGFYDCWNGCWALILCYDSHFRLLLLFIIIPHFNILLRSNDFICNYFITKPIYLFTSFFSFFLFFSSSSNCVFFLFRFVYPLWLM